MFCGRACGRPCAGPSVMLSGRTQLVLGRFKRCGLDDVLLWERTDVQDPAVQQFVLHGFGVIQNWGQIIRGTDMTTPRQVVYCNSDGCTLVLDGYQSGGLFFPLRIREPELVVVHQDLERLEALFLAIVLAGQGGRIQYPRRGGLSMEFDENVRLWQQVQRVATDAELQELLDEWIFSNR